MRTPTSDRTIYRRKWAGTIAAMGMAGIAAWSMAGCGHHADSRDASGAEADPPAVVQVVKVQVAKPHPGGMAGACTQPGSLHAFEFAELFAKEPGYLKTQQVDIGDRVTRGQVLAELDAPELEIAVQELDAELLQARTEVEQMKARQVTAQAKWQAAAAAVTQAEAEVGRATAQRVFREKQYQRIKSLFELKSIDERLVDEKQDEMEAARAAEGAAKAAIVTAKADMAAAAAVMEEAKANVVNAEAKVQVAAAALAKAKVFAGYLKITSPYDGVISKRTYNRGDFIRGADCNGGSPLLVVERNDLLRCVVWVPDPDVPWIDRGNPATIRIGALPDEVFHGVVARTAEAEDPQSRLMRVEIDLPNSTGRLRPGMFGQVTIKLRAKPGALALPLSALVGESKDGQRSVYVVRNGKAYLVPVKVGADDGTNVEIRQGLTAADDVVVHASGALADGVAVTVVTDNQT